MIDIITCRGCGEGLNGSTNMLKLVTEGLDPLRFRTLGDLDYPAAVGPAGAGALGPSEDESIRVGLDALAAMIRATPNVVGILGYSLGSELVSKFLEAQAAGQYADCVIAFSACVANPLRRAGDSIDPNPVGYGINGEHGPWLQHPHFEAANPADAITSCPADSPLRTLADTVSAFSFAQLGGWTQDLAGRLLQDRFQPATFGWWLHPIQTWNLYSTAAQGVLGYLSGKTHVMTYMDDGFCTRLAAAINAQIGA